MWPVLSNLLRSALTLALCEGWVCLAASPASCVQMQPYAADNCCLQAVEDAHMALFYNMGQCCAAGSRCVPLQAACVVLQPSPWHLQRTLSSKDLHRAALRSFF